MLLCVQAQSASLVEASNTEMAYSLLDSEAGPNIADDVSSLILNLMLTILFIPVQAQSASLMEASNTGNVDMAYSLLDSGADPNLADEVSTLILKMFCHNLFHTGWMDCTIGSSK